MTCRYVQVVSMFTTSVLELTHTLTHTHSHIYIADTYGKILKLLTTSTGVLIDKPTTNAVALTILESKLVKYLSSDTHRHTNNLYGCHIRKSSRPVSFLRNTQALVLIDKLTI